MGDYYITPMRADCSYRALATSRLELCWLVMIGRTIIRSSLCVRHLRARRPTADQRDGIGRINRQRVTSWFARRSWFCRVYRRTETSDRRPASFKRVDSWLHCSVCLSVVRDMYTVGCRQNDWTQWENSLGLHLSQHTLQLKHSLRQRTDWAAFLSRVWNFLLKSAICPWQNKFDMLCTGNILICLKAHAQ